MAAPRNTVMLVRYVLVVRQELDSSSRVLALPRQARYSFATRGFAELVLEKKRAELAPTLKERVGTLEVLAVFCDSYAMPRRGTFLDDYQEPGALSKLVPKTRCDDCSAYGRWPIHTGTQVPRCKACLRKSTRPSL
jgi:hypothetical protein